MAVAKPTIILIQGGWHVPSTYSSFVNSLRSAGFEVHVPGLPSMNESRPPNADLADDTALIRSYVQSLIEAGRTVIAIMHSYGGQVGTNALWGLGQEDGGHPAARSGGVAHLIYVCAFALPEGGSMVGKVREFGHEHLLPVAFEFADDGSCINRDPRTLLIGPGIQDAEADKYISSLVRWNGKSIYQEVDRCAWKEIPATYVYTTQDMTVPLEYQQSMVVQMEMEGGEVDTVELATGHCPNVTMTAELVDVVKHVARICGDEE